VITSLLSFISRHASLALALGVLAGLVFPPLATAARPLLLPSVVCLLTASLIRLDWVALGEYVRRPSLPLALNVWLLFATPTLCWFALQWIELPGTLEIALILAAGAPSIVTAVALTQLFRLDSPLAVASLVIGVFFTPLGLAYSFALLLDLPYQLPLGEFAVRFLIFIVLPFLIAFFIRKALGSANLTKYWDPMGGITVLFIIIFGVTVMDGVTDRFLTDPTTVLVYTAAAFAVAIASHILGYWLFIWQGSQFALTAALLSGYRNMAVIYALVGDQFGEDFFLYLSVHQFPIYLMPLLTEWIFRRMLRNG